MKKALIVILVVMNIAAIVCATSLFLNKPEEAPEVPVYWEEMPPNTNENLKYFGYYHFGDDRVEEVASFGHSNMCKVDGDHEEDLMRLLDNGFQVFIMIRHMFFSDGEINPEWSEKWESVKTLINPHLDQILGFYVDEPIKRNMPNSENVGKSKESFHFACQKVREDYPDKRMMAVLTIFDIIYSDYSREYYQYCTDLGYDFYPTWNKDEVLDNVETLENSIAVGGQDIWLIPKAFYTVDYKEGDLYWLMEDQTLPIGHDVLDWIKGSYEIAVEDQRIVGIFCFVYDNDTFTVPMRKFFLKESEYYNEEVYGVYNQIGRAVIANDK
ncbi:MAG: hypothetical protein PHI19_02940 [Clostridia bacterium]|nr:hypothetical protein [Clostridia bacterium]